MGDICFTQNGVCHPVGTIQPGVQVATPQLWAFLTSSCSVLRTKKGSISLLYVKRLSSYAADSECENKTLQNNAPAEYCVC